MGDIERSGNEIIAANYDLQIKHTSIILNEKLNQLKQLDVRLDHVKTVEIKQLELKRDVLEKEVANLKLEIAKTKPIEVKPEKGGN